MIVFILDRLVLGENCYAYEQCTGTSNSGVCIADHRDNATLTCQCDYGFIKYNDRCLQGIVNRNYSLNSNCIDLRKFKCSRHYIRVVFYIHK